MTPIRHNGDAIATALGAPLSAPERITRQYSISINGRFRAPYGIPDLLDPEGFALVFENTAKGARDTILTFPLQAGNKKDACWLKPQGCPLSIKRAMLDGGNYIVYVRARTTGGDPLELCYFTDQNILGTHSRDLATIVTVDGSRTQLTLNPTIQMNFDQVP